MRLTKQQKLTLYEAAKEHWVTAESASYGYERAFQKAKQVSAGMKIGTVAAAILTAASALSPWSWLTFATSIITAALASIDQTFTPSASIQKVWDCRNRLQGIKQDLTVCVISLGDVEDLADGAQPVVEIGKRLTEITNTPVDILDSDRQRAFQAYEWTTIASTFRRLDQHAPVHGREQEGDALADDAAGVVRVARTMSEPVGGRK